MILGAALRQSVSLRSLSWAKKSKKRKNKYAFLYYEGRKNPYMPRMGLP